MRGSKLIVFLLVISAGIGLARDSASGNGGKGKKTLYKGQIELGDGKGCEFSTEIEHVLFQLNSVQNKYKVIRIKIVNHSKAALSLSKEKDKMEVHFENGVIPGILDLSKHDPALWDAFDGKMRRTLVYPQNAEGWGEEENIFIFFPNPNLKELPRMFRFTIESLQGKQVDIYDVTPVKAE